MIGGVIAVREQLERLPNRYAGLTIQVEEEGTSIGALTSGTNASVNCIIRV